MQQYYEKWLRNLEQNEIRALNQYTGDDYELINDYLRGFRDNLGHVDPEVLNDLQSALNKVELPQDTIVYRGTDEKPFLSMVDIDKTGSVDWGSLVGKTYKDNAFLSTFVGKSSAFNHLDFLWEIKLPKGTTGGMLNKVSNYPNEAEFLLNAGQKLFITSVKVDASGKVNIIMELIQR